MNSMERHEELDQFINLLAVIAYIGAGFGKDFSLKCLNLSLVLNLLPKLMGCQKGSKRKMPFLLPHPFALVGKMFSRETQELPFAHQKPVGFTVPPWTMAP